MVDRFIGAFVEKLVLLEEWIGSKVQYRVMPPLTAHFHDRHSVQTVAKQIAEALGKLAQHEKDDAKSTGDSLLRKVVKELVALGVPGLVLLIAVSVSGYAGAAAFTSALAVLGGPFGMYGGIGVLLLLVPVSKALTEFGLPRMAQAVVRGLMAKGESTQSIRAKIDSIPKWVISRDLRAKLDEVLAQAA